MAGEGGGGGADACAVADACGVCDGSQERGDDGVCEGCDGGGGVELLMLRNGTGWNGNGEVESLGRGGC